MGRLETIHKKNARRANLKALVLGTVAVAGVLSVAVIAPNVLVAMKDLGMLPAKRQKEFIRASRERLVRQGMLAYHDGLLRLTPKGERELRRLRLTEFAIKKPRHWDGRWRVLIFDIPEHRRGTRDKIRLTLRAMGFVRLQQSVWIYPYDCEDIVALLKADFKIGKDLLYMIVEVLEYDTPVRKIFGLPAPE